MDDARSGFVADNKERQKALAAALAQIEKQFGKGSVMRLADGEVVEDIEVVSTGSLGLDIALGIGGLPRGRVVEIYGPESSGKTTGAPPPLSMPNMRLMRSTRKSSASIFRNCSFPSPTPVSRRLKLPTPWCALGRSI